MDELSKVQGMPQDALARKNAARASAAEGGPQFPTVVVLCGSTRFSAAFREANLRETLAGRIVLSIGCDMRSDTEIFGGMSEGELARVKAELDELHLEKVKIADEVLILNCDDYVGASTSRELAYARALGKRVRWFVMPSRHALPADMAPLDIPVAPVRPCENCGKPMDNLQGQYIMQSIDGTKEVCHRCEPPMRATGRAVVAQAKGMMGK